MTRISSQDTSDHSRLSRATGSFKSDKASRAHPLRRRQLRGQHRIDTLLDAAADVFAEVGFEAATTNAIAAHAGASPGSLYQFFRNKDGMAEALIKRYADRLRATRDDAFALEIAELALPKMIDHVVDRLVEFQMMNPAFTALWAGSNQSSRLASISREFHDAVLQRVEVILAARAPRLPRRTIARCARVSVQLVRALLPLVEEANPSQRAAMVREMKAAQLGYLRPIFSTPSRKSHSQTVHLTTPPRTAHRGR